MTANPSGAVPEQTPTAPGAERPTVAVWRTNWIPPSETFIVNQTAATSRWRPLRVAVRRLPGKPLVEPDFVAFPGGIRGRAAHAVTARTLGYPAVFRRYLRRQDTRLLHAHFGPGGVKALPVARRLRLPLAVTFHGFDVALPDHQGAAAYRRQLTELFAEATGLIAVSDFVAARLVELGADPVKVHRHYIGIPVPDAPTDDPADRRDRIVFVGRLVEVKGADHLLRAVAALGAAAPPVTIVGDGPLRQQLQRFAGRAGLEAEFTGNLPPQQVSQQLRRATVFCGPSHTVRTENGGSVAEAFGLTFLEAAAAGLPVVGYRHAGVAEAVADGETGLLAPEADVDALAERLRAVLTDRALAARLGQAGRRRVTERFDVRTRTRELESLYDHLARR